MGQTLANHSYVDLSLVGNDLSGSDSCLSLTWAHVVVILRVLIVETGIYLMEVDCHSLDMVISMSIVELREFI